MTKKFRLSGKRKKMRLNRHTIIVIEPPPISRMLTLEEGEAKLRKILLAAR
ncbi:MAG: hypothetical protein HY514_04080 [Candidatus Aenigmarchaeota archaeon]|nr:hypothetical protein [Candidatus Aenigmarchaeota archaeon]